MARFGGQQMEALMTRLQVDESMPIANPLVDRVVEQSQNRVEGANFDVRKHLLEYDDVLNTQREKIYGQRDLVFKKSRSFRRYLGDAQHRSPKASGKYPLGSRKR